MTIRTRRSGLSFVVVVVVVVLVVVVVVVFVGRAFFSTRAAPDLPSCL